MSEAIRTISVIDDEPTVCRAIGRLLRSAGLRCRTFGSVDNFLASTEALDTTCVIADLRLPGRPAIELPAALADRPRRIPVILLTAQDTPETREAAHRAGVAAFFRKPVDDQALLDAIEWVVGPVGRDDFVSKPS